MKKRLAGSALAFMLIFAAACGGNEEADSPDTAASPTPTEKEATVAIKSPQEGASVQGNTVALDLEVEGLKIVAAAEDKGSDETGHFHVFVDREPPPVGSVIPQEPGIIHSASDPVLIEGLAPAEHTFRVVLGDKGHKRLSESVAQVKVTTAGPTLDLTAPAEIPANEEGRLEIAVTGVKLVPAAEDPGEGPEKTGHLHILIDPDKELLAAIGQGAADPAKAKPIPPEEENKIIHTTNTVYNVKGLEPGEHVIWVVVGDKTHVPLNPLVADKATILIK